MLLKSCKVEFFKEMSLVIRLKFPVIPKRPSSIKNVFVAFNYPPTPTTVMKLNRKSVQRLIDLFPVFHTLHAFTTNKTELKKENLDQHFAFLLQTYQFLFI